MKPSLEQMQKLPKWASDWIACCERRCSDAETALKEYLDTVSPSLIYTLNGLSEKHYIQNDRVCFELKNGRITVALKDDILECHASYGSARLVVVPHITNAVHLEIEAES